MAIGHAGEETSSDEVGPVNGVGVGTGETEARLTGEGAAACFPAIQTPELHEAHLLRITAVQHFLDRDVVVRCVELGIGRLERLPVIAENLFEGVLVDP